MNKSEWISTKHQSKENIKKETMRPEKISPIQKKFKQPLKLRRNFNPPFKKPVTPSKKIHTPPLQRNIPNKSISPSKKVHTPSLKSNIPNKSIPPSKKVHTPSLKRNIPNKSIQKYEKISVKEDITKKQEIEKQETEKKIFNDETTTKQKRIPNQCGIKKKTTKRKRNSSSSEENSFSSTFWALSDSDSDSESLGQPSIRVGKLQTPDVIRLSFSGLDAETKLIFYDFIESLDNFEIVEDDVTAADYVIVSKPSRTIKIIKAILLGRTIVKDSWMWYLIENQGQIPPDSDTYKANEWYPRKEKTPILTEKKIFIHGELPIVREDVQELIELAGGEVAESYVLSDLCIYGKTQVSLPQNKNIPFVSFKWLTDSLFSFSLQDYGKYLI